MATENATRLVRIGNGTKHLYGVYRCECGVEKQIKDHSVRTGGTRSCGCIRREVARAKCTIHGQSGTRTHNAWLGMIERANPKGQDAKRYAERGITIAERWRVYANFLADMGECPPGLTLERENNDGNYEPGNCRWATRAEQSRNTCRTIKLTYNGKTQCVKDWGIELGVEPNTLIVRIRRGWPAERVLGTAVVTPKKSPTLTAHQMTDILQRYRKGCEINGVSALMAEFNTTREAITKVLRDAGVLPPS